jgi:hypothetical protein
VSEAGYTVADLARRYRVGEDKVRGWIKAGMLPAINTAATTCVKPRFVVLPEALALFEKRRSVAPPQKAQRRKRKTDVVDFYPD